MSCAFLFIVYCSSGERSRPNIRIHVWKANLVRLELPVCCFHFQSFHICLGKGCYWVSYMLFIISLLSGVGFILILKYGIYKAIGPILAVFVNAFVQMYLWANQTRLSILTYDVAESVLTIVSRRTTLFCFLFCRCTKEKVQRLPLSSISRVFVHPLCCSQTLCIISANGAILLPNGLYPKDTLDQFVEFLNRKLLSNNPTQYQQALQFYIQYRDQKKCPCRNKQQTLAYDIASVNSEMATLDEQPDLPLTSLQKPNYDSTNLPKDFV